jgi:hypothetical protein
VHGRELSGERQARYAKVREQGGRVLSTPREWRATFLRRDVARTAVRKVLAWKPEQLVIAHGQRVTEPGEDALRRGFAWLSP